ncbi:MAG: glycosyltransferase family 4 protein [Actinomycetota bacterium]
MKVLLWHGYLLTGSGSNVYTANVARSWRAQGHDVLVLCQERNVEAFPFVDGIATFSPDGTRLESAALRDPVPAGRCVIARPDLGGLLPVYVYDDYAGFTVKRFVDLTDAELDDYTSRNITAMETAIDVHRPDAIITGHEVMGPKIALEACRRSSSTYLAKLHGSGLEFAVKEQDRYRAFAAEGLGGASIVVGGSEYMLREAASVVGNLPATAVVNPGVDVELFNPRGREEPPAASVVFVGKLIALKGVHNLLAAIGLTTRPMTVTIVGYGGFEDGLHRLAAALSSGDIETARALARRGEHRPLEDLEDFLAGPLEPGYLGRLRDVPVTFTGRLEHEPLAQFLPSVDVLVVPSVVPEAFGMVAAEAAACGVLPIVPNHSGIAEAGRAVEEAIGEPGLLTFDAADPIRGIGAAIERVLGIPFEERRLMGLRAVEVARERWAWDRVGERLLDLARGVAQRPG